MLFQLKIFGCLLLVLAPLVGRTQPSAFVIRGQLGKLDSPAKVYLVRAYDITDSVALRQGQFELRGRCAGPEKVTLFVQRRGWDKHLNLLSSLVDKVDLYLAPGETTLTSPDSLLNATIGGTRLAEANDRLQGSIRPLVHQQQAIERAYNSHPNWQQDSAFQRLINIRQQAVATVNTQTSFAFIHRNPTSWISLNLLEVFTNSRLDYGQMAAAYQALSPALRASATGQRVGQWLLDYKKWLTRRKLVLPGQVAPDFTLSDPDGRLVSLRDFRGRYVLLEFWASWCGPCRASLPSLRQTYQRFKAQPFTILGVSLDDKKSEWTEAVQQEDLPWVQVSDLQGTKKGIAQRYCVDGVPYSYLLDPTGKIISISPTREELEQLLAKLLR